MEELDGKRVRNINIADLVGITARLPDDKHQGSSLKKVQDIILDLQNRPGISADEVAAHVAVLDSIDAAKPSVEALRSMLSSPVAVLRMCLALVKLWGATDPSKPQVSVKSNPTAEVKRESQEDEAWRVILNS